MACGTVTMKSCLGLISLFFWMCAVALIVIAGIIMAEYGHIKELAQSVDIIVPSAILIGAGVFLFIVGLLGCIGGMKENKAALTIFFILTLIVIVGEVAATALAYHFSDKLQDKLTDKLHSMIKTCSNESDATHETKCDELDYIQRTMHCCGADNYTDWFKWTNSDAEVPQSCCKDDNCTVTEDTNSTVAYDMIYDEGCSNKVVDTLNKEFVWILVGTIAIAVLQALSLVAACVLLCRTKEMPYASLDSHGYRV